MSEKILKCPKCGNKEIHCIAGAGEREINDIKKMNFDCVYGHVDYNKLKNEKGVEYKVDGDGHLYVKLIEQWKLLGWPRHSSLKPSIILNTPKPKAEEYSFFCKCPFISRNYKDFIN